MLFSKIHYVVQFCNKIFLKVKKICFQIFCSAYAFNYTETSRFFQKIKFLVSLKAKKAIWHTQFTLKFLMLRDKISTLLLKTQQLIFDN